MVRGIRPRTLAVGLSALAVTALVQRTEAVKQRDQIPPLRQIWCESALDWARDISALPGVPKG